MDICPPRSYNVQKKNAIDLFEDERIVIFLFMPQVSEDEISETLSHSIQDSSLIFAKLTLTI